MNKTLKTVLFTLLTLSILSIAILEFTGVRASDFLKSFNKKEVVKSATPNSAEKKIRKNIPKTEVKFDATSHDFGKIKSGTIAEHKYTVTNIGSNPLIIEEVITTCGCTIPTYTKTPIPPGEKGEIAIAFESYGKSGNVDKNIFVKSNAQEESIPLNFKAVVTQ